MPITIGSNIASLRSQRYLERSSQQLSSTFERLASGQRINRASDDAAGLSIAESLKSGARVYTQALRNVNDGVSFLNVAQGALQQLSLIATRQAELAEQAASGTYSGAQRASLHREANSLVQEYNRVLRSTSFNGINALDGALSQFRIQQGYGAEESTAVALGSELGTRAGDGTFQALVTSSVTGGLTTTSGDFNGDGKLDFISSQGAINQVYIGQGDGTFTLGVTLPIAAAFMYDGLAADLNQDGKLDFVTTDSVSNTVVIYHGNGNATFQAGISIATGLAQTRPVRAGDINGDGLLDLVAGDAFVTGASIILNRGSGQYATATTQALNQSFELADFNQDGYVDFLAAQTNPKIYFGSSSGTFSQSPSITLASTGFNRVSTADINGDGNADIIGWASGLSVALGDGKGGFGSFTSSLTQFNYNPDVPVFNDFNGDGHLDAALYTYVNTIDVFYGKGDGTFSARNSYSTGAGSGAGMSSGDFTGDGVTDLLAGNYSSGTFLFRGNAESTGRRVPFQYAVDLMSVAGAKSALTTSLSYLNRITGELGVIGAAQSRFETSLSTLQSNVLNYDAARGRIADTDVASESANLVRLGISQQAATAVLAQANLGPQLALSLLS